MHNIAGKYTVRFLEGFSSEEIKKWLSKVLTPHPFPCTFPY